LDVGEGHFAPYVTGFPTVKIESEQAARYSERGYSNKKLVSDLKAQVEKVTKEITKLKAKK